MATFSQRQVSSGLRTSAIPRPSWAAAPCLPLPGITRHTSVSVASPAPRLAAPRLGEQQAQAQVICRATASEGKAPAEEGELAKTVTLGLLFGGWYLANIYFNIYNKQALKAFAYPLTLTSSQFLVGAVIVLLSWATGLTKAPKITATTLQNIFPLAVVHTMGNLLTNVSFGLVAVSFTHTIKAMEPFFSVALSALFLGDIPPPSVLFTLLPIVGGVACASMGEASFNWHGFLSAMASNLTFQSRNVLSKKLMKKESKAEKLDNIEVFSLITLWSAVILLPISLFLEGWGLTPANLAALGVKDVSKALYHAFMSGLLFHTYQQVSFMILARVSPVTHSIGNCVKRVIVIVASVIVFRNPVTTQNAIGTAVALLGVFAYSQASRLAEEAKKAKKAA